MTSLILSSLNNSVCHLQKITWCHGVLCICLINAPQNVVPHQADYVALTYPWLAFPQTRSWALGPILLFHSWTRDKRDLSLISDTRIVVGSILHCCSVKTMSKAGSVLLWHDHSYYGGHFYWPSVHCQHCHQTLVFFNEADVVCNTNIGGSLSQTILEIRTTDL